MSNVAIQAEHIGKRYQIGTVKKSYSTFRDTLVEAVKAPVRRTRDLLSGRAVNSEPKEELWALKDVSFEVNHGEVLGIIGRNGAGKSTLLKILARITEPSIGQAKVYGRVGALLEVGTGFHEELTGRENIYLNGSILGMGRHEIDRKMDEIVAFAEVEKFIDTPVKHYSSGMGLRLGFAVAAHLETEILIVDEVLAVGDAKFQKKCLGKIGAIAQQGRTVLFVSHNMYAVQIFCDRALWLDHGRVVDVGDTHTMIAAYLNNATETSREVIWDDPATAPGHPAMKLHRVSVSPDVTVQLSEDSDLSADENSAIYINTPVRIEIEYWNLLPDANLHVTLHVHDDQSAMAFETGSYESGAHRIPQAIGLYRTVCHIPANLLNDNMYRISVLFVKNEALMMWRKEDVIYFQVNDVPELRNVDYHDKWAGVVRPRLQWESNLLDAEIKTTNLKQAGDQNTR